MATRPVTRSILMLVSACSRRHLIAHAAGGFTQLTRGFDTSTNTYLPWTLYMLLAKRYQAVGVPVVNAAGSGMYLV